MNGDKPAFPNGYDSQTPGPGLNKRELIAAMALQGCLACPDIEGTPKWTPDALAVIAVDCADALLAKLKQ